MRTIRKRRDQTVQQYLLASDFDQTLSFNDSGVVLAELVGVQGFHDRVKGLAQINLVQQGAELSYLILHDPEFRRIRREHLIEAGKLIRLKHDVALFAKTLDTLADGYKFNFHVISAAPQEIIQSALEGIVPLENIHGTKFYYEPGNGEVKAIIRASAGWGKVTVLEEIRARLGISHDHIVYMGDGSSDLPVMMHVNQYDGLTNAGRGDEFITRASAGWGKVTVLEEIRARLGISHDHIVYMGDGSSDLPVMMHVNQYDGLTIAVSEAEFITRIARRTVLSDNAMSVLVPVLEEVLRWDSSKIRRYFATQGLMLREWGKMRTDHLTIEESPEVQSAPEPTGDAATESARLQAPAVPG